MRDAVIVAFLGLGLVVAAGIVVAVGIAFAAVGSPWYLYVIVVLAGIFVVVADRLSRRRLR